MTPRDIFGLVIRLIGLALFVLGLSYLYSPIAMVFRPSSTDYPMSEYILFGVICVLVGAYFVRGAPHILRFAYPEKE